MKNSAKIYVCRDYIELGKPLPHKFMTHERIPGIYELFNKSSKLCGTVRINQMGEVIAFMPNPNLFKSLACNHIITGVIDIDKLTELSNEIVEGNYDLLSIKTVYPEVELILDSKSTLGFNISFIYITDDNMNTRLFYVGCHNE